MASAENSSSRSGTWAVVLAGGAGVRLRSLVQAVCGDERPKQFVPLLGTRTLLGQTLDRVGIAIPPRRTVIVTISHHAPYVEEERLAGRGYRLAAQPADRGTAAGILLPLQVVARKDRDAVVAIFPSDHFILEQELFMGHIAALTAWVERHPERIVLVGAQPTDFEIEYGWIEPAEGIGFASSTPIFGVKRFWEKPTLATARTCLAGGCLWNTFVMVARVSTLLAAAYDAVPELRCVESAGLEPAEIERIYRQVPTVDFSREVLAACPPSLAVSTLPPLTWSDLGSPARVLKLARHLGLRPPWLGAVEQRA